MINTNLPPVLHRSKLWPIIGQIFTIDTAMPHFNAPAGGDPCEYPDKLYFSRN